MKNKILKQSVSMLMAVLTIISVVTISASAEELLPEDCGGAIYTTSEITMTKDITFTSHENTDLGDDGAIDSGGAIYTTGEITMTKDITFTSHENTDLGDDGAIDNGGAIYTTGEIVMTDITFTSHENTNPGDSGEISTDTGIVQAEGETIEEPQPVEETHVQDEDTSETAENIEIPESLAVTEVPDDSCDNSDAAPIGVVAGIDITGKVVPHPIPDDPEIEDLKGKNYKIRQTVGDVIVTIGESVIPFGHTISNFIRMRSPQAKDMDGAETAIDLIADTASYAFPIAAPLVSVAKDIALKIRKLF